MGRRLQQRGRHYLVTCVCGEQGAKPPVWTLVYRRCDGHGSPQGQNRRGLAVKKEK